MERVERVEPGQDLHHRDQFDGAGTWQILCPVLNAPSAAARLAAGVAAGAAAGDAHGRLAIG